MRHSTLEVGSSCNRVAALSFKLWGNAKSERGDVNSQRPLHVHTCTPGSDGLAENADHGPDFHLP